MNLSYLRTLLIAEHFAKPQSVGRINLAIENLEEGLGLLAQLGHPYHLEPGPPGLPQEYPKVLFHLVMAPNGRVIANSWEEENLGENWWPTLGQAQHSDGMATQFAGRGGVRGRNLPVVQSGEAARGAPALSNDEIIEAWKKKV